MRYISRPIGNSCLVKSECARHEYPHGKGLLSCRTTEVCTACQLSQHGMFSCNCKSKLRVASFLLWLKISACQEVLASSSRLDGYFLQCPLKGSLYDCSGLQIICLQDPKCKTANRRHYDAARLCVSWVKISFLALCDVSDKKLPQ